MTRGPSAWVAVMPELSREKEQIWITRNHLAALGVATVFIALLAFFLGVKVGSSSAGPEEEARPPALTMDAARQAELEAVLRQAARTAPARDFSFPSELPADSVTPPGAGQSGDAATTGPLTTAEPSEAQAALSADAPVGAVPHGGWSVQIGIYATPAEADARMAELVEQELKPYRVAALVDGQNSWRVRLGGYGTREAAEEALPELRAALNLAELSVVPAP